MNEHEATSGTRDIMNLTPQEAYLRPSTLAVPVEAILARHIVARTVIVGPIVILGAWLFTDRLGAVSAAIGVAIVAANFLLSGAVMSWAAARSMQAYHAAALLGFFLRLGFITVAVLLVANMFDVDRRALGIAAVVAYLALLTWEAVAVMNGSRREIEWTS
jgi:hypothetical protein